MALINDIRAQVRRESAILDAIDRQFVQDLEPVLRRLNRQTRRLILELEQSNGRLVASRAQLGRALALRAQFQQALTDAGYSTLVTATLDAPLDQLAAEVLRGRTIAARAARLTPIDLEILTAWKVIHQADLLELGDDVATSVWRATVDGVIGNRTTADLVDEVAELTARTAPQARTIVDTAASTYSRQVDQLGLEASPDDRFLYVGPNDSKTRPFCRQWVGKTRTRAQLDDLSNGQIPNTLLTAGGWNCRHKWFFLADLAVEDVAA